MDAIFSEWKGGKRNEGFIGKFCVAIIFLMLCGCKTPEPVIKTVEKRVEKRVEAPDTRIPLTISVLKRLSNSFEDMDTVIETFQLVLLGRITLEREYSEPNDSVERGRVKFEDVHIRDVLIVPDQVEGKVFKPSVINGEIILHVSFEEGSDDTMIFSRKKNDPNGYFYLKLDADEHTPLYGEEKGTIEYGGQKYKRVV
ncbi:MAG: hypothetical protein LBU16_09920 [Treponema sp.]|jgi:hypothetical protein|nr:hypothetical protein [Treponema sp.]